MSGNAGFRITVFFNLFFNNQKSRSSVYVNTGLVRTVQALKEHISFIFNVPHDDFELHCENNFLPPEEDIRVLKADDTVLIVPNKCGRRKLGQSNELLVEDNIDHVSINFEVNSQLNEPKNKLKQKRSAIQAGEFKDSQEIDSNAHELQTDAHCKSDLKKNQKEPNLIDNEHVVIETNAIIDIENKSPTNGTSMIRKINFFEHLTHSTDSNSEKAKDPMMRCSLPKCNSYNNYENAQTAAVITEESPLKETPTFVVNRRKRTSTPYVKSVGTLLKELKCIEINTLDHNEDNAVGDDIHSPIKKRKRYRKRKRVIKSDDIPDLKKTLTHTTYVNQTHPTHIKFSDNIEIIPNDPLLSDNVMKNENSTDSAIEVVEVLSSNGGSLDININTLAPTMTLASIETSPSMKNITPKAGDLIAFKMLRLTDTYTPELSKYITAKTIYYDVVSKSIRLQIIEGGDQMKLPNGKFSLEVLEGIEERGQLNEENTINWDQLIEPRLLYP